MSAVSPETSCLTGKQMTPVELIASERHLFIEASAGSGKTTLLVELIAGIIEQSLAEIQEILCVTFTERAASELKAKIFARLGKSAKTNPAAQTAIENFSLNRIGTIHSFCLAALKDDPAYAAGEGEVGSGQTNDEDLFEAAREWVYRTVWPAMEHAKLAEYLAGLDFGKMLGFGKERALDAELRKKALYLFAVPSAKIVPAVSGAGEIHDALGFKAFTLGKITEKMRELADAENSLTYSRMITAVADALQRAPFRARLESQFKYALIDEFQDTDPTQWEIFRTLFLKPDTKKNASKLIVVGDPKQAIYKFRGADVFVYLHAREEFRRENAIIESLATNYRSTPEILTALDYVFRRPLVTAVWQKAGIAYLTPEVGKEPAAYAAGESGVDFYYTAGYEKAVEDIYPQVVAADIIDIQAAHPGWRIAVVACKHRNLEKFTEAFRARGISYAYYKQAPDYSRIEAEHLAAFVRSFALPVEEGLIAAGTTIFMKKPDAANYYHMLSGFIAQNRIARFVAALHADAAPLHLLLSSGGDSTVYHAWRVLFQYLTDLVGKTIFDLRSLLQVLHELADAETHDEESFGDMLRPKDAVTLITVQSAKGLDWDVVVVADGRHDKFWNDFAFFHDAGGAVVVPAEDEAFDAADNKLLSIEDEARITQLNLLYVALTRAKVKTIACISPAFRSSAPGPTAYFLGDMTKPELFGESGARFIELGRAWAQLDQGRQAANKARPLPAPVDTSGISGRIAERTSFTALMRESENAETEAAPSAAYTYISDVLPRGAQTGQLLHSILEVCDFSLLQDRAAMDSSPMVAELLKETEIAFAEEAIRIRIKDLLHNTATARLPLVNSVHTTLAGLNAGTLWREMPFWSSAKVHRILKNSQSAKRLSMHGFMDLVFSTDGGDYYILDYKSNSLADVDPATIDEYTRAHYGLQAEIYAEALQTYLDQNYPGKNKRVRGCFFLFLRYLKSGESTGIHFMEFSHG